MTPTTASKDSPPEPLIPFIGAAGIGVIEGSAHAFYPPALPLCGEANR